MPIYEYKCSFCNNIFEVIKGFFDLKELICPKCNSSVKKIISKNTFHLKGNGWYKTDYPGNNIKK